MPKARACIAALVPLVVVMVAACGSSDDSSSGGGDGGVQTITLPDGAVVTIGGGNGMDATVLGTEPDGAVITSLPDGSTSVLVDGGAATSATPCMMNSDCVSKICLPGGSCGAPSCSDGAQNGNETGSDCGGSCPACGDLKGCLKPADCTSGVCTMDVCQVPTNTDGVKNGNETGVDCGGMGNKTCGTGQGCAAASDCTSDVCTNKLCVAAVCNDNTEDGTETDVDCGGTGCPRCADGKKCKINTDCLDGACKDLGTGLGLRCQPPSDTDGIKDGNETDVDCGGTGNTPCAPGKMCMAGTDCASAGCDYNHTCAIHRSCVGTSTSGGHYGADTCGAGGPGSYPSDVASANYESCCTTVAVTVTEGASKTAVTVQMDKYKVTAGRMRAFIESTGGNIAGFIATARAAGQVPALPVDDGTNGTSPTVLPAAWDMYLPTSMNGSTTEAADCEEGQWNAAKGTCTAVQAGPIYTSAVNHIGPVIFKDNSQTLQGCSYDSPGTHMYYLGATDSEGKAPAFAQSEYDQKAMQCVDYMTAQAFCIWDGGRLETEEEWYAAWGAGTYPWSSDTTVLDSNKVAISGLSVKSQLAGTDSYNPPQMAHCDTTTTTGIDSASRVCSGGASACVNSVCAPAATYTNCRFPTGTDAELVAGKNSAGCPTWTFPGAGSSIETADWEYNYEYPTLGSGTGANLNTDYMVFMSAPGRTLGRAPSTGTVEGAADILGDTFDFTSNVHNETAPVFHSASNISGAVAGVKWSGNGSWEVHAYQKGTLSGGEWSDPHQYGPYNILSKYGKTGLRCVHTN